MSFFAQFEWNSQSIYESEKRCEQERQRKSDNSCQIRTFRKYYVFKEIKYKGGKMQENSS